MAAVKRIKLGSQGLEVSAQGLGCMGVSFFYGPPKPEPEMITLIHHAINSGVTFLDTSDVYGPHTNEILLGKALKGGMRDRVELATKFGARFEDDKLEIHGDPAYNLPKLQPENLDHNKKLLERVNEIAEKKGCTTSQLALAWVHHQGDAGTTKMENFNQNIKALSVKLTPEEMAELKSIASVDAVKSDRDMYSYASYKNSETPPLSSWKAS
ncbi:hypothetical protein Patl1_24185 [Pistacia atlantica]|uniref:Uncharacterized protein n=1 Tax=Pistacia atlantica TaxID=434234 RepID=A0ACC1A170_9ROSI|nr:hypothetical protein Patl1_24185 [Pistacia atlantica]